MTEIPPFEPKNLQVGDRYWEGRFPNGTGWTVLWVHEKGVLVQIGEDAEPTFLAYRYQFADGIARVKRGGVQIYPPPEPKFKVGDELREVVDHSNLMTVTEVVAISVPPYWGYKGTGGILTWAHEQHLELVPPAPAWTPTVGEFCSHPHYGWVLPTSVKDDPTDDEIQYYECFSERGGLRGFGSKSPSAKALKPLAPPVDEVADIVDGCLLGNDARAIARELCSSDKLTILRRKP